MTSKERFLAAINRQTPDRLPVTTHHVMPYFLAQYMGGISPQAFFDHFVLDPIHWILPMRPDAGRGEYWNEMLPGTVASDTWHAEMIELPAWKYRVQRYTIHTPKGELSCVLEFDRHTCWLTERIIKRKQDIDLIGEFMTRPLCDVHAANEEAALFGGRGLVRGTMPCFEFFGQPGCWQDAACLVGIEPLIMLALEDPDWVHRLLGILLERKLAYARSMAGANIDILELGGGDASSTVISPALFEEFVLPYLKQVFGAIDARVRFLHNDAAGLVTAPFLPQIGVNMFNFSYQHTMADMRRLTTDQVTLVGNIPPRDVLAAGTPETVRRSVAALVNGGCDGRRAVLSCGGGLPPGVRTENIQAFLEAAGYRK